MLAKLFTFWLLLLLPVLSISAQGGALHSKLQTCNSLQDSCHTLLQLTKHYQDHNSDSSQYYIDLLDERLPALSTNTQSAYQLELLCAKAVRNASLGQYNTAEHFLVQAEDVASFDLLPLSPIYHARAKVAALKGEYRRSIESISHYLKLLKETSNPGEIASSYFFSSEQYMKIGRYDSALFALDSAQQYYNLAGLAIGAAESVLAKSKVYQALEDHIHAVALTQAAAYLYEQLEKPELESSCYRQLGNLYFELGKLDSAAWSHTKALQSTHNEKTRIICLQELGGFYLHDDRYSEALNYYKEALIHAESYSLDEQKGTVYNQIGHVYQQKGMLDSANYFFRKSLLIRMEVQNAVALIDAMMDISELHFAIYQEKGRGNEIVISEDFAIRAYEIAHSIHYPEELHRTATQLYQIYKRKSDFRRSLIYNEVAMQAAEQLKSNEIDHELSRLQNQYLLQRHKEESRLNKDSLTLAAQTEASRLSKAESNLYLLVSLGVALVLIATLVVLYVVLRKRKRQFSSKIEESVGQIKEQKEKIESIVDEYQKSIKELSTSRQFAEEQTLKLRKQDRELTKLSHTKEKLFSILAHDLKSPFSGMIGLTDILLEGGESIRAEERAKMLKLINDTVRKTFNLLNNLLTWAQSQKGELSYQPVQVDVNELIHDSVKLYRHRIKRKTIQLDLNLHDNLVVVGDDDMLHTVIRNLVTNAIKFTPIRGQIRIFTERKIDGLVKIVVQDNGIGIASDRLSTLFQIEHAKSTPGTNKESGTGLGLILCKELMDLHDGNIIIESKENYGTKATIELHAFLNRRAELLKSRSRKKEPVDSY